MNSFAYNGSIARHEARVFRGPPVPDLGIDLKRKTLTVVPLQLVEAEPIVPLPVPLPLAPPAWLDELTEFNEALRSLFLREGESGIETIVIQRAVARHYGFTVGDLKSSDRAAPLVRARHVALYLTRIMTQRSLSQIGMSFGGRDHTSVLNGIRKIAAKRLLDPDLDARINKIENQIRDRA